jgi:hypothetical protein
LGALAKGIRADLKAAEGAWLERLKRYRAAGEKLLQAKAKVRHGEWEGWLKDNCGLSRRQAEKYLAFAKAPRGAHLEDEEATWRCCSGRGKKRADPQRPSKPGGPPPKTHVLSTTSDEDNEAYLRLLHQGGEAFGTGEDDFATVLEALRRCAKAHWFRPRSKGGVK